MLLLGEPGNGNNHSLLIVRSCLGDVIEKANNQQEQLESILGSPLLCALVAKARSLRLIKAQTDLPPSE